MPAPIAKGIILLSSVIIAAGIAAYENPEVRQWFEERRRKVAVTISDIADELDPGRPSARRRRAAAEDASRREDTSDAAEERRRRARQEIYERGIILEHRRRPAPERSGSSFDDMVDSQGQLRGTTDQGIASTFETSANQGLRNRSHQADVVALGSTMANPFDDELGGAIEDKATLERERSTTLVETEPLQIDTTQQGTSRGDLTPTTSVAPSTLLSGPAVFTPTSTTHPQSDLHIAPAQNQQAPAQSYQSIQEWATAASSGPASFYSPPESEQNFQPLDSSTIRTPSRMSSETASVIGTNDVMSEAEDLGAELQSNTDADTLSNWSEIGSQISENSGHQL